MRNGLDTATVVDVVTDGDFPGAAEYARAMVETVSHLTDRPILDARIRLSRCRRRAGGRAVVAQANLHFGGRTVRAQVEADTAVEAIDGVAARLRRGIEHLHRVWDVRRGSVSAPPWRAEGTLQSSLTYASADEDAPEVVRRKTYAMAPCTVDEAAAEMDLLGYDFHLFTEIGSGAVAVLYRGGPTGRRLALVAPALAGVVAPFRGLVTVSPHSVPCLTEEQAAARLARLDLAFVFYIDAAQGRASLLYRRYDGHFGVITPAG